MKKSIIPLFAVMLTCIFSIQGLCARNSAANASGKRLILMLGADARNAQDLITNWLNKLGINMVPKKTASSDSTETPITITMGDIKLTGSLNTDHTAQEIKKLLQITIPMVQYGGREYYGSIDEKITTQAEGRLRFDDGDITYCPQNNSIAIFYSQTDRPNLSMKVIPIGKVTSDLSVLDEIDNFINVVFEIHN